MAGVALAVSLAVPAVAAGALVSRIAVFPLSPAILRIVPLNPTLFRNLPGCEQGLRGHSTPDRTGTYILPQSSAASGTRGLPRVAEAAAKAPKAFRDKDLPRPDLFRTNLEKSDRLRNNDGIDMR
jgi:hypothetical protein